MQSRDLLLQTNSYLFFQEYGLQYEIRLCEQKASGKPAMSCSKFQKHELNHLIWHFYLLDKEGEPFKILMWFIMHWKVSNNFGMHHLLISESLKDFTTHLQYLTHLGSGKWRAAGHENQVSLTATARQFYFHWTVGGCWKLHRIHTRHNHIQPAADTVLHQIPLVKKHPYKKLDISLNNGLFSG